MPTDPVCGMFVEPGPSALQLTRDNRTYFFCAETCLRSFAEPEEERRRLVRRLALAWPLSLAVLVLTYLVSFPFSLLVTAALAAVVQFYSGSVFYRGTFDSLRHRTWNMDILIAVGTSAAFIYSLAVLALPGQLPAAYYFDASALIITLILTGNYLEHLTRVRAGSALRHLDQLLPRTAEVLRGETTTTVPIDAVRPGDLLRVRPGGRVPSDGRILSGRTTLDESLLTGESLPVAKGPGDAVIAGAINGEGAIDLEATGVGSDTFVAQVGQLLSEAEMARVPLQRTADRIASVFVPTVLTLAGLAALGWYFLGGSGFTVALLVFVTVSITACPCAFGIATPAAILVATGRAAEAGVLFRGGDSIERAARADLVLTDKTGTLTSASPEVAEVVSASAAPSSEVLALAAGLEAGSEHALARAVRTRAAALSLTPAPVRDVQVDPGVGVRGSLNGQPVSILRGQAATEQGIDLNPVRASIGAAEAAGDTWSVVLERGRLLGLLRFRAPVSPGVPGAVRALGAMGVEVAMVTGDHRAAAEKVAREVGIRSVEAETTPARKVEIVRKFQERGRRVAFVGDGINDAAALSAADVGLAIGTGTDVAREAGQVLLVRSDFAGVPDALGLARAAVRKVRGNLLWAIGYNIVLLPVAAGVLVPFFGFSVYDVLPMVGALAMGLSSATVVLNSLSLRRAIGSRIAPRVPRASPRAEPQPSG